LIQRAQKIITLANRPTPGPLSTPEGAGTSWGTCGRGRFAPKILLHSISSSPPMKSTSPPSGLFARQAGEAGFSYSWVIMLCRIRIMAEVTVSKKC
jgi:hypothetical protein